MEKVKLLDAVTATGQGGLAYLSPGRWKIALSLAATNGSESITLHEADDGGDQRVIAKNGAAVALTEADPAVEYVSGGQDVAATVGDGSEAVTVTASKVERSTR